MEMSLEFKDKLVYKRFISNPMDGKLGDIVWWWLEEFHTAVMTSAYRPNGTGVHSTLPFRGIDFRSWIYSNPSGMVKYTNQTWKYDPQRPYMEVAMLHDTGSGEHIHLQSHPRTVRYNGSNL